jgi:hypothetical protein
MAESARENAVDTTRFDEITARLAKFPSRRGVLRLLGAATFGTTGLAFLGDAEGKRRKKGKGKKKKARPNCNDGKKNGTETDVDCGGGKCSRCGLDKTCNSRDDCISALCTNGVCKACVINDDCGLDSNGEGCFCRDISTGSRACTRQLGRFLLNGKCTDCQSPEVCVEMGNGVECNLPCGV